MGASCSHKSPKSPELLEANRLHLEAMKLSQQLEHELDSLGLLARNVGEKSAIDSLKNLIEVWEENMVEVPGFPHAHGNGPHEHKPAPAMTDASMRDYQRQSKEAILELKQAAGQITSSRK